MKNKAPQFTPEYTYERIEGILKGATEKAKAGTLTLEDKLYGIAAGYAQDFVDVSRAIKKPLDLTARTEDKLFMCLLRVCTANQAQGKTTAENKLDMAKKFGYYQLFSIVNSMNCEKKYAEIVVLGKTPGESRLVIKSLPDNNGKTYTFDPVAAANATIDKMTVLDPQKSRGAVLFGQLAPFYQRLENDLLNRISDK